MNDDIPQIKDQPTGTFFALDPDGDAGLFFYGIVYSDGKAVEHTLTGSAANDEMICK